jgi:hemolysin activation/secretion protein
MQDGKGGADDINATINFKLRGVGDQMTDCSGQTTSQFECMRYDATPDYMYLRGGIDHTEPVLWGMSIFARVDGQITSGPLISNEQYVAGGVDSVRGYYTAEQAGDNGLRGSLEVRGPQWGGGMLNDLRVLAFADGAKLTVINPLPSQTASFNLSSVGFGLRSQASNANLTLDVARPCRDTQYTTAGKIRVEFKASVAF